jgi:hypothetical protein
MTDNTMIKKKGTNKQKAKKKTNKKTKNDNLQNTIHDIKGRAIQSPHNTGDDLT